jgi:hypothetical protein
LERASDAMEGIVEVAEQAAPTTEASRGPSRRPAALWRSATIARSGRAGPRPTRAADGMEAVSNGVEEPFIGSQERLLGVDER